MNDWKFLQMIKASGWPLEPMLLASGANFNARLDGGLVPLHWACAHGKAGLVKHLILNEVNVEDADDEGQTPLKMALNSGSFQVVMLVIDRLKALTAPPPDLALRERLIVCFSKGHAGCQEPSGAITEGLGPNCEKGRRHYRALIYLFRVMPHE